MNDPTPDHPGSFLPYYHAGENNFNLWDGVNGNLMCDMFKGGGGRQILVNPVTGAQELMNGNYGRIGYDQSYSAPCLKGRTAVSIINANYSKPNYATTRPWRYVECNLDTWNPSTKNYAASVSTPITVGAGLTEKEFCHPYDWDDNTGTYRTTPLPWQPGEPWYGVAGAPAPYFRTKEWDGQCAVYIPELNSIFSRAWSFARGSNPLQGEGRNVLINCTTKVMSAYDPGGRWYTDDGYTWGAPAGQSVWNKVEYIPALHILIIHMAASSDVRIIKFA